VDQLLTLTMGSALKTSNLLSQMPRIQIDPVVGLVKLDFSKLGGINQNAIPAGASHFQVKIGIVQVPKKANVKGKSFFSCEENYYNKDESIDELLVFV
jgi:hypothetical protein